MDRNSFALVFLCSVVVALRKESVDRNNLSDIDSKFGGRRSPQGERG